MMRTGRFISSLMLSMFLTFCLTAAAWAAMSDEDFVQLCSSGTVQDIQDALMNGANPNAKDNNGVTALMVATITNTKAVSLLLEVGADVNAKTEWGMTALMVAASLNKTPEVIDLLLKHGAYINEKSNSGGTALMYAALNNPNTDFLFFLLEAGADIDAKDNDGMTALDHARRFGDKDVIKVLEDASDNPEADRSILNAL